RFSPEGLSATTVFQTVACRPFNSVRSPVNTDDCASLGTLVADSADAAVICLLPSDSCLRSAGHHSVPQCILEPNITEINGDHEHFRNRPAVRPARVGAALGRQINSICDDIV